MDRFNSPLDRVRIAAPCKADWEQMIGTDRVRFCGQCNLNVYNLSSMTKHDAVSWFERLVSSQNSRSLPAGVPWFKRQTSDVKKAR